MKEDDKKFKIMFRKKSCDKFRLILFFWGKFIITTFLSVIFYGVFWYSSDTNVKNASLYLGSLVLILLPSLIEYPLVSKKLHIKAKKISVNLILIFIILNLLLLYYYSYITEYVILKKYFVPFSTFFVIPLTLDLLKKFLENRPPNVQILFHDRSKMAEINSGISHSYHYDLPKDIKFKGLPIFIKNNSNSPITISNIRLEILDTPYIVPNSSARRICKLDSEKYKWIFLFHEYDLENVMIIQPKNGELFFIEKDEYNIFFDKIGMMEEPFSRIIQPMYVTVNDGFNLNEYSSEKIYYPQVNLYFLTL